jgi:hypothetical protein
VAKIDASFKPIARKPQKPVVQQKRTSYFGDGYVIVHECENAYQTEDEFILSDQNEDCLITE